MIGILIPEFPSQTHAFFWREISVLRAMGESICIVSTRRPDPAECRHAFAEDAARETHYVYPPRCVSAALSLMRRPIATLRAIRYLTGLAESPWLRRLKELGILVCAANLLEFARERGLRHIHVQSCADSAHLAALCHVLGGPSYSLFLHGDLPVYGTDHGSKMRRATFVSTAGPHLKDQIVERVGVPSDRVMATFMGLDTDQLTDERRRTYTPDRLHVVTVARLNLSKGHKHALAAVREAIDRGCDIRYTIAGEGPHRAEIEADIRRLGLADRVAMVGTLSEAEVFDLLQVADVFLLPSVGLGEAWPVSVMEAMACGLPVVSSIIGATPEMITHDVDGLLVGQADESGLADAMVALSRRPEVRRRLGEAARRRAVASFDCRISTSRLLEAIRSAEAASEGDGHVLIRQGGPI